MNKVKPIKDEAKLSLIQEELEKETDPRGERMFLLFMVGLHTGLRISDLVRLKVKHVSGDEIRLVEKKTGKKTVIPLDAVIRPIIQDRTRGMKQEEWLFPSRERQGNGDVKPITTRQAYNDMQIIARRFKLGDAIGCHTLRKTFGYWHYKNNGNLAMLRDWFNHTDDSVTLRYIGMDDEEKRKSMQGFNPGRFAYEPREPVNRGRSGREAEEMEIDRLDRTKQGQIMGRKAQAKRKRK